MAKNSPGTLNSRTVRISLHTYLLLKEMSEHTGLSIAEALDKLLWDTKSIPKILQPAMSVASSKPAMSVARLIPVLSVNGDKRVAIAVKSKGGIING